MTVKSDRWIKKMALEHRMIDPFEDRQVRQGVISYGVSSYGYDVRVAEDFKIFTNVNSTIIDPKNFDERSFVDVKGPHCIIPPNSFALARTVEYLRIPRNVVTVCVGKCLTGDARVVDAATGDYVPIETFVKEGRRSTVALDGWKLGQAQVTEHQENGRQAVFRLETRSGLEVKATATHPFRTFDGWRALSELRPGDRIAAARSCPVFGTEEWSEHEAALLGFMLSDGQCSTPGHSPRYTSGDPRLVEIFTRAAHDFGCEVTAAGDFGWNVVNHHGRGGVPETNRMTVWLRELGVAVKSAAKHVPARVFRAKKERVATFLRTLYSGDGCAYTSPSGGVYLEYATISRRLADDVRHLLLRFGVFAAVKRHKAKQDYEAYRVLVTDKDAIARFAREIGFVPGSKKQLALDGVLARIRERPKKKSNFDTLPREAWGVMREAVHRSGYSLSEVGIRSTNPAQSLPHAMLRQAATAIADPKLEALADADVVWDTIVAIEPAGEELVYDVTVPGPHCFLANDLVAHNSTYARCGIIVNVTPFEPEWEGYATLEISNTTPLPAKIYSNEGLCQVLFFESDEQCEVSYADKKGKYQNQPPEIVLPRLQ